jgi:PmbA protein
MQDLLTLAEDLIVRARSKGADEADARIGVSASLGVAQRLGRREKLERAESRGLSLRVFIGKKKASVSSSDLQPAMLDELVDRAIAMARVVPQDQYCGLAEPELLATSWPDLDLFDPAEPSERALGDIVAAAEGAALAVPGVSNSEGAEAGWSRSEGIVAATNGFRAHRRDTRWSFSVAVLAGEGTAMERDYDYSSAIYGSDLEIAERIGRSAGEKAVNRLNPRRIETGKMPIVYDPRVSGSLLGHFAGAISGAGIARGTSFLKDHLNQPIFAKGISIVDDPHRRRGLGSKPFDDEGVANRKFALVEDGVLKTWLLDCRSARQLGLKTTGHGSGGGPGPTNLYLEPGPLSPSQLMADIDKGLYVTEMIGMGVNGVTGDYSRGAAGFLIENGQLSVPVSEVTIAGNLKEMFLNIRPANDLAFRYRVNSPTLRIEGMTLAGA